MQQGSTIIEAVREYILTCPFLKDGKVNVDHLGHDLEYSIDPLPCEPVVQKYTDGGCKKQYQFAFTSKERFDGDARTSIDNSGFYEAFERWIEQNNMRDILPELSGKQSALSIEINTGGYLFDTDEDLARYQIQCRLIYRQEA